MVYDAAQLLEFTKITLVSFVINIFEFKTNIHTAI